MATDGTYGSPFRMAMGGAFKGITQSAPAYVVAGATGFIVGLTVSAYASGREPLDKDERDYGAAGGAALATILTTVFLQRANQSPIRVNWASGSSLVSAFIPVFLSLDPFNQEMFRSCSRESWFVPSLVFSAFTLYSLWIQPIKGLRIDLVPIGSQ